MQNTICTNCSRRLHTWSKTLREDYNGCNILMDEHLNVSVADLSSPHTPINAETIALGWVSNGYMATNEQLIVRNVVTCEYRIAQHHLGDTNV